MKDLKDIINEEKFAYTWQNAFVCAIKELFAAAQGKKGKEIMQKWFSDKDAAHELYIFLDRLGHTPKSKSPEDLYKMITSDENAVIVDDNYNLR